MWFVRQTLFVIEFYWQSCEFLSVLLNQYHRYPPHDAVTSKKTYLGAYTVLRMAEMFVFDDFWNIFSDKGTLKGLDFINACNYLNIELRLDQEQILSDAYNFNRRQWMYLLENSQINGSMDKWKKLHSHYLHNIDRDNIKSTSNTLCCYQWRLPKYQSSQSEILCSGFIRKATDIFIPYDVIGILVYYVFDNIVDKINQLGNMDVFESGLFEYKSCIFAVLLYPKGVTESNDSDDGKQQPMVVKLIWIDAPKEITEITMNIKFCFAEKFIDTVIDDKSLNFIFRGARRTIDLENYIKSLTFDAIKHLLTFTFTFSITKFIAYGGENADVIIFADNEDQPLLTAEDDLSKPAEDALKSIFNEFATNEDGTMSTDDIQKNLIERDIIVVQSVANVSCSDTLSCEEFLDIYKTGCMQTPTHVRKDFKIFGYATDLIKMTDKYIKPIILDEGICESKNTDVFRWQLSEEEITKMKESKTSKSVIRSKIFMLHKLKFQAWLLPNGNTTEEIGNCDVVIHLLAIPPYLKSVMTYHQITFNDKLLQLILSYKRQDFDKDDMYIWHGDVMKTKDIINCGSAPIFTLSMELINMYNSEGQLTSINNHKQLDNNHLIFSPLSNKHQWKVTNFSIDTCDESSMFRSGPFNIDGFDFILEFMPKHGNQCFLKLYLLKLPLNISIINIIYLLKLKETQSECLWTEQIGHDSIDLGLLDWDDDCLSISQLQDLNLLTFIADIQIINAYDNDGNCIVYDGEEQELKQDRIGFELPAPQHYEWKISPKLEITNVSTASVQISETFTLFGIKWYLMLIPRCSKWDSRICVYVGTADFPLNVSAMSIFIKVSTKAPSGADAHSYSLQLNDIKHYFKLECSQSNDKLQDVEELIFNLEMMLTAIYDNDGNDLSRKYIYDKKDDLDVGELKENYDHGTVNSVNHYRWDINNLEPKIVESQFYDDIKNGFEFKVQLDCTKDVDNSDKIYIILKSMPSDFKQLSIECNIKIEEINANISGIAHFKESKLKGLLVDVTFDLEEVEKMTVAITMKVIAKWQ